MMTAGIALPVAAPSLYGLYVGSAQMKIDDVEISFPALPAGLDGFTILQISDLHVGPFMDSAMLQPIVRSINALAPDLVAITGDIINWGSAYIDEAADGLAGLQAKHGVYAVLGNHDFYCDTDTLCSKLEKTGLQILRNEWREIRPEGGGLLQLVGIDDSKSRRMRDTNIHNLQKALHQAPENGFKVLLSHRPTVFDEAAALGMRLTLAGHTHAGQLISPFGNGRAWSLAKLFYDRDYGLYDRNGSYLYINRGLGVVGPPLRINCPREITRIVLRRRNPQV
jgi:predicted MPP superfamily phosphohydrolase